MRGNQACVRNPIRFRTYFFVKRNSSCTNRYEKPSSFWCGRIAPVIYRRRPQPKLNINCDSKQADQIAWCIWANGLTLLEIQAF